MEIKNLQYRTPMVKVVVVTPSNLICQSPTEKFGVEYDPDGLDE